MKAFWLVGVAVVLASAGAAFAQSERGGVPGRPAAAPQRGGDFGLPVSISRIQRELTYARSVDPLDLHLDYYVEVYGKPARFDLLFPETDLTRGQVPYAGVTHREFVQAVTPEAFKSPPMDVANLARVLQRWLQGRSGK